MFSKPMVLDDIQIFMWHLLFDVKKDMLRSIVSISFFLSEVYEMITLSKENFGV